MQVLVIDDSRAVRMMATRALLSVDAIDRVIEAKSAEDAINEVLPVEPVDLILCDWEMGGMTGLDFLQALRSADWNVPFGLITSESSAAQLESAMSSGAAFLLAKPFQEAELTATVDEYLANGTVTTVRTAPPHLGYRSTTEDLMRGLFHQRVTVSPAQEPPARLQARWTARYVDEDAMFAGMLIVDSVLAAALGAALTILPRGLADRWAETGTLPEVLMENFHEVASVLAQVVSSDDRRCVLGDLEAFAAGENLPDIDKITAAAVTENFVVEIVGYREGLLSLVVA